MSFSIKKTYKTLPTPSSSVESMPRTEQKTTKLMADFDDIFGDAPKADGSEAKKGGGNVSAVTATAAPTAPIVTYSHAVGMRMSKTSSKNNSDCF